MVSFDDLKVSLSTYITRNRRVTYQDLLKWSSSNKVGNALLYLIIRELIHEKRFKVSGEYVIGTIRIGNNDIKLSIPMYIEVPGEVTKQSIPTRRQARQRRTRSSSILEVFSEDKRPEEKRTTVEINENVVREVRTETSKEVKHEDAQQKAEPKVEEHKEEVRSINEAREPRGKIRK
ncbi:hypothetical protein [Vulcanisaeta distributa]|uniref:hypothetical protein n=1 Tax=Vulcanisaeta distributa TaxID=164451 RepID=UPI0006D0EBB6|nr:hypothetical protein [Vulcanisaeta distributa]